MRKLYYRQERIPFGVYDLDEANRMVEKFNAERNKIKERSEGRRTMHLLRRGRGYRNGKLRYCQDLPLKYAQRVAIYLIINKPIYYNIGE